jgi:hypothetical protein
VIGKYFHRSGSGGKAGMEMEDGRPDQAGCHENQHWPSTGRQYERRHSPGGFFSAASHAAGVDAIKDGDR